MYVLIVGGGKVGARLAKTLAAQGHQVTIVEVNRDHCAVLEDAHGGVRISAATATSPTSRGGHAANADALVAATGHDEDNLVVPLLGKKSTMPLTVGA